MESKLDSILYIETDIPRGMTTSEYRRQRAIAKRRPRRRLPLRIRFAI